MINITLDTGNKQIKTKHNMFVAGITVSNTSAFVPEEDYYKRNGKYYVLTGERQVFMRDKTTNDRYYDLALMGIVKELEYRSSLSDDNKEKVEYDKQKVYEINLLCGLPPAHLKDSALKNRYAGYFKRDVEKVTYKNKTWNIQIKKTVVYPQCFAALMTVFSKIKTKPRVIGIDMGGFTADYITMRNGKADVNSVDSLENGIIILYQRVKKACAAKDFLVTEDDIDDILLNKSQGLSGMIVKIVKDETSKFVNDFIESFREYQIDLKNYHIVFIGGASILLKPYFEKCQLIKSMEFVEDICANAKGYEILYSIANKGRA